MTQALISRRALLVGGLSLPLVIRRAAAWQMRIRDAAHAHGFRFGAAVKGSNLDRPSAPADNPALAALIADECDLVTPEYEMKLRTVWPDRESQQRQEDERFGPADQIVDWARRNGVLVRIHAPVFTVNGMPDWLNDLGEEDPGAATAIVLSFVERLASRYIDVAAAIDVVNEAVASDGSGLSEHWLYRHGRYDIIADAFVLACEAAPDVELVYNDQILPHDHWVHPERRRAVQALVEECRKRNAPIHTVGLQSHLTHKQGRPFDATAWLHYLTDFEAMGCRLTITELDAHDCWLEGSQGERDAEIERAVGDYLAATLEATSIRDVVCWGLSDDTKRFPVGGEVVTACLERGRDGVPSTPYDAELHPKPMADAIIRAMRQAPARWDETR